MALFQRCVFQLFQSTAQLVGTRRILRAASDAVNFADDIVDVLPAHQLTDTLQVAIATTEKEDLLDDVILVCRNVNELRASSLRFVLYMFCLHCF